MWRSDNTTPLDRTLRTMSDVVPFLLPLDVVSDYLKEFWNHVRVQVEDEKMRKDSEYDKTLIMTVPADWSACAAERMHEAARRAGLCDSEYRFMVIREPEAAAVCILRHHRSVYSLKVRSYFRFNDSMVCVNKF